MRTLRVFIIDDNPFVRELLCQNLRKRTRFEVSGFDSAEDCLLNTLVKPDLIVLDYYLDGIFEKNVNGGEALKLFNDRFPGIDIILISGEANLPVLEEFKRINSIQYILKSDQTFERIAELVTERINDRYNAA